MRKLTLIAIFGLVLNGCATAPARTPQNDSYLVTAAKLYGKSLFVLAPSCERPESIENPMHYASCVNLISLEGNANTEQSAAKIALRYSQADAQIAKLKCTADGTCNKPGFFELNLLMNHNRNVFEALKAALYAANAAENKRIADSRPIKCSSFVGGNYINTECR